MHFAQIPSTLYEDKSWQHEHSRPLTATQRIGRAALLDFEPKFGQPRAKSQSPFRDSYDPVIMKDPYPVLLNEDATDVAAEISRLLEDLKLRFPGKTSTETANMLEYMTENWAMHKSQIASYWLVKLDSTKREKVIDIVRHNVNRVIQCKELLSDFKYNKITALINRIFNMMLSCHGHGLWGCFTTPQESWEKSLSRSKRNMAKVDLDISRRIVNLCKDCLLIVYRFTHDIEWQPMKLKAPFSGDGLEKYDKKLSYTPRALQFHGRNSYYASGSVMPPPAPYSKQGNWYRKNYQW